MRTNALFVSVCLFAIASCSPKYPKCNSDSDCRENEFCVNGQCQQCRQDADCDKGQQCRGGRCEDIAGYCESAADCPNGQACLNNRCKACSEDAECGPGARCRAGRCLQPGQCASDEDCPENQECQGGNCVSPPTGVQSATCQPQPIFFDFNAAGLTSAATSSLQQAAECIKSVNGRTLRIEGHCDPRGTEEYNLALGDRRARAALQYLERLGVATKRIRPVSKGKLEATGSDPSSWARDRKVIFVWE